MRELIVAGFKGEFTAEEVLLDLMKMKQIHLIDLDYAVVAARRGDGTMTVRHNNVVVLADAAAGGQWGMFMGGPAGFFIGAVIGAAIGKSVEVLRHIGISDDFIHEIGRTLKEGNSAIFIRARKSLSDKVVEELRRFDARLLRSSLAIPDEEKLLRELKQEMAPKEIRPD